MGWVPVVSLEGARADQPSASALPVGSLYKVTDEAGRPVERTDGTSWTLYATGSPAEVLVKDGTTPPEELTLEDGTDYLYKD